MMTILLISLVAFLCFLGAIATAFLAFALLCSIAGDVEQNNRLASDRSRSHGLPGCVGLNWTHEDREREYAYDPLTMYPYDPGTIYVDRWFGSDFTGDGNLPETAYRTTRKAMESRNWKNIVLVPKPSGLPE